MAEANPEGTWCGEREKNNYKGLRENVKSGGQPIYSKKGEVLFMDKQSRKERRVDKETRRNKREK